MTRASSAVESLIGLERVHAHEAVSLKVRERPEPVELRLEEELGIVERLRDAEEPHGSEVGRRMSRRSAFDTHPAEHALLRQDVAA